ncbi:hypothetical protein MRX96_006071 [Rhipicephalus microplus]
MAVGTTSAGEQERRGPCHFAAAAEAGPCRCEVFTHSASSSSGRGSLCSADGTAAPERSAHMCRASSPASSQRLLAAPAWQPRVSWSPETQQPDAAPAMRKLSFNTKLELVRSDEQEDSRWRRQCSIAKARSGVGQCPNFRAPFLWYRR